ncbi:WbqC-like protein family protein [Tenacibaculum sp. MAR_2009_124]|uniref:WbqC family protein n=1 Tax=Tenacibaculum sp. MAR_2009_124 TaxID=1250059 RepID=UPI0008966963|nr:WbqC family protein [Tenacibaculum sp. MAR_2009_124]SEC90022.1 WbqC-like protein family protein [Tenacibaculum sp. MAR_2009_124]
MALFIPTYFAPISQYAAIYQSDRVVFEVHDNFQKQTYRNRFCIYGANGKLSLSIPVKHKTNEGRKKTRDTLVENDFPWQQQHLKSLQTAYRSSPFFEFFEDELTTIFSKKYKYLHDVNLDTYSFVSEALELDHDYIKTEDYVIEVDNDFRQLALAKKGISIEMDSYIQMFDDKHGFLPNLSILDLLFMEGRNTISFLEKISVNLK